MAATTIPANVRKEKLKLCPFCVLCHTDKDLELNHVEPDKPATIDNLIVLCHTCHMTKWHRAIIQPHNHNALQRKGIKEAQARGVHFGKKPADYENTMRLIAEKSTQFNVDSMTTEREIMTEANVKSVCYHKCKRMLLDAMKQDKWPYTWKKPKQIRTRPLYEHMLLRLRQEEGYSGVD